MVVYNTRRPYAGSTRALVIAIDVGTTFSGVSYAILEPGQIPKIHSVTRFPGQEHNAGDTKIPSVLYYDPNGKVKAAGAEAESAQIVARAEDDGWLKVDLFKLRMRPKTMKLDMNGMKLSPLPRGKLAADVFGDFLRYLFKCTRHFIQDTHANGAALWAAVERDIHLVLSHPNGWEGAQQSKMRSAAIKAGLLPDTDDGRARIRFVTEGEASLHACVLNGLAVDVLAEIGNGFVVADAGGGTLDISTYVIRGTAPLVIEEIAPPDCVFAGSVFVSRRARAFLEEKLKLSKYGTPDSLDHITKRFDETTKRLFRDNNESQFIVFGSPLDKDLKVGIRSGQLKLTGAEVAELFEPSIQAAVNSITTQIKASAGVVKAVWLVGGFAANSWLFAQLRERLTSLGVTVNRPDAQTSKAVADGAIGFFCDHHVSARMSKYMYGVEYLRECNMDDEEHVLRQSRLLQLPSGPRLLPDAFDCILQKGLRVKESSVFSRKYYTEVTKLSTLALFEVEIWCYRGGDDVPKWIDRDSDNFGSLCFVQADLSKLSDSAQPKAGLNGQTYYTIVFSIEIHFGLTEFKARMKWNDNGKTRYGPASIVYNERGSRLDEDELTAGGDDDGFSRDISQSKHRSAPVSPTRSGYPAQRSISSSSRTDRAGSDAQSDAERSSRRRTKGKERDSEPPTRAIPPSEPTPVEGKSRLTQLGETLAGVLSGGWLPGSTTATQPPSASPTLHAVSESVSPHPATPSQETPPPRTRSRGDASPVIPGGLPTHDVYEPPLDFPAQRNSSIPPSPRARSPTSQNVRSPKQGPHRDISGSNLDPTYLDRTPTATSNRSRLSSTSSPWSAAPKASSAVRSRKTSLARGIEPPPEPSVPADEPSFAVARSRRASISASAVHELVQEAHRSTPDGGVIPKSWRSSIAPDASSEVPTTQIAPAPTTSEPKESTAWINPYKKGSATGTPNVRSPAMSRKNTPTQPPPPEPIDVMQMVNAPISIPKSEPNFADTRFESGHEQPNEQPPPSSPIKTRRKKSAVSVTTDTATLGNAPGPASATKSPWGRRSIPGFEGLGEGEIPTQEPAPPTGMGGSFGSRPASVVEASWSQPEPEPTSGLVSEMTGEPPVVETPLDQSAHVPEPEPAPVEQHAPPPLELTASSSPVPEPSHTPAPTKGKKKNRKQSMAMDTPTTPAVADSGQALDAPQNVTTEPALDVTEPAPAVETPPVDLPVSPPPVEEQPTTPITKGKGKNRRKSVVDTPLAPSAPPSLWNFNPTPATGATVADAQPVDETPQPVDETPPPVADVAPPDSWATDMHHHDETSHAPATQHPDLGWSDGGQAQAHTFEGLDLNTKLDPIVTSTNDAPTAEHVDPPTPTPVSATTSAKKKKKKARETNAVDTSTPNVVEPRTPTPKPTSPQAESHPPVVDPLMGATAHDDQGGASTYATNSDLFSFGDSQFNLDGYGHEAAGHHQGDAQTSHTDWLANPDTVHVTSDTSNWQFGFGAQDETHAGGESHLEMTGANPTTDDGGFGDPAHDQTNVGEGGHHVASTAMEGGQDSAAGAGTSNTLFDDFGGDGATVPEPVPEPVANEPANKAEQRLSIVIPGDPPATETEQTAEPKTTAEAETPAPNSEVPPSAVVDTPQTEPTTDKKAAPKKKKKKK